MALKSARFHLRLLKSTSEQDDAPARALENSTPRSQGWLSARFCDFPQVLGFELCSPDPPPQVPGWSHHVAEGRDSDDSHGEEEDDEDELTLKSIQVLVHETCIPRSIEIFAAKGGGLSAEFAEEARFMENVTEDDYLMEELRCSKFSYIGTLEFKRESPMHTRELQRLDGIRVPDCKFVVFRITGYHPNPKNYFQQAGIAAIAASGFSTRYTRALTRIRSQLGGYRVRQPLGFGEKSTNEQPGEISLGNNGLASTRFASSQNEFSPRFNEELHHEILQMSTDSQEISSFKASTLLHPEPEPVEVEFGLKYDSWTAALLTHVLNAKEHYVLVENFEAADAINEAAKFLRGGRSVRLTSLHNQKTQKVIEDDVKGVKELGARLVTERLIAIKEVVEARGMKNYLLRVAPHEGKEICASVGFHSLKKIAKEAKRLMKRLEDIEKRQRRRKKRLMKKAARLARESSEEEEMWANFMDGIAMGEEIDYDSDEIERRRKARAEEEEDDEFRSNRGGSVDVAKA